MVRRIGSRAFSAVLKAADLVAAAGVLFVLASRTMVRGALGRRRSNAASPRKLLVLDMSYTMADVQKRQLHEPIIARDLDGFFSHVWSVHPCATVSAPAADPETFGPLIVTPLAERHTVIEARVGRFRTLRVLPAVNFILAQYALFRHLDGLIREEGIAAVRAGDPYYLGSLALALSRLNRIPSVFRIALNFDTFYEHMGLLAFPRLFRWRWVEVMIVRFALRRADLVAGSNQDSLTFARNNGARTEHSTLFRVGNLLHKAHFQPPEQRPDSSPILEELGLAGKTFSITISRFEHMKHVDDVVRMLAKVRSEGIDLYALLVGDGRLRPDLIALTQSLGVTGEVIFAGNRPQEWIAAVLPRAAVVVSPHMGRGLTEAMLSGVPAAAYDVDWQSEIVISGQTGELVEYRNWQQMADAVQKLLRDPTYAQRLGQQARAFTLEMMDPVRLSQHERAEWTKLFARFEQGDRREADARSA